MRGQATKTTPQKEKEGLPHGEKGPHIVKKTLHGEKGLSYGEKTFTCHFSGGGGGGSGERLLLPTCGRPCITISFNVMDAVILESRSIIAE